MIFPNHLSNVHHHTFQLTPHLCGLESTYPSEAENSTNVSALHVQPTQHVSFSRAVAITKSQIPTLLDTLRQQLVGHVPVDIVFDQISVGDDVVRAIL